MRFDRSAMARGIIDLDAKVAHRALDLGVAEEEAAPARRLPVRR